MGFAPTTFSLARKRSTAELHPLFCLVPGPGVEPGSHLFQRRAVTTLAILALKYKIYFNFNFNFSKVGSAGLEPATLRM